MSGWTFETSLRWKGSEEATATAEGRPPVEVSGPPEFGGPAGRWTPEHLLVAAAESCQLLTTLYFVGKMGIRLKSYESRARGHMEKTPNGLRFKQVDVEISAVTETEQDAARMKEAVEKGEKFCPVGGGVNFPVRVTLQCRAG